MIVFCFDDVKELGNAFCSWSCFGFYFFEGFPQEIQRSSSSESFVALVVRFPAFCMDDVLCLSDYVHCIWLIVNAEI